MNSWTKSTIGDVSSVVTKGTTPTTGAGGFSHAGVNFIKVESITGNGQIDLQRVAFVSEEVHNKLRRSILQDGDVLFSIAGTIGRVAQVTGDHLPANTNQALAIIRPNTEIINQHFLKYVLLDTRNVNVALSRVVQSVQANLSLSQLSAMEFLLPEISVQTAIAEILGALDDKITLNSKLADTTDNFIQLQFEAAMQRAVPELKPFLEAFDVEFGEAFKGDKFVEPGIGRPLIRIRDLKTFTSQIWTSESRPKEVIVNEGDVVVGMDAEFRATTWLGEPGLLNQRVCRVTSKLGKSALVREALRKPLAAIENYKTATTVIHLNKKDLEENSVLLPSTEAIAFFETTTENLYQFRVALASENRTLAATRDALLPKLMSGKLRVKDAEALVESVV